MSITVCGCGSGGAVESEGKAGGKGKGGPGGGGGPAPVVLGVAERRAVPLEVRAIGNVEAFSRVDIKAQVSGQLAEVFFNEGEEVKKGQMLFQIDPRQYQQSVKQAEAALAAEKAALGQAEANYARAVAEAKNARAQAGRYAGLAVKGVVSKEQNEQFQTTADASEKGAIATQATIESAKAAVQGAEAKLADSKLLLGYTRITAPISGRTGNLPLKAGNLVQANAAEPMVTINQVSPVYATFSVPEGALAQIRSYGSNTKGQLRVQATPAQDGGGKAAEGTLDFVDNIVDTTTGTIQLKAKFANTERRLWPGQFVNVALVLATPEAIVVPTDAVQNAQRGNYVFVVKDDGSAEQRTVQVARNWGEYAVIGTGVTPGEKVIVEGQLRVREGGKVRAVQAANKSFAP